MLYWKRLPIFFALFTIISIPLVDVSFSQTTEERGTEIAKEMDVRDTGWGNCSTRVKMILSNRQGETSQRILRSNFLEVVGNGKGDKSLIIFDQPRDISGTALLSHSKVLEPDDQWLYLPALKRVKRISSANKSGPFVGSEFSFEDLLPQDFDKFSYRWLQDESFEGQDCFVVERIPQYDNSGYTRQVIWIDKDEYRPLKIIFFDRKNSLLKTLIYQKYQKYLDQYWRADALNMVNHQTGKETLLEFEDYRFQTGLDEGYFSPSRLKRIR